MLDKWRAVILAGGMGTRMKSLTPKVLNHICGREMIWFVADSLDKAGFSEHILVIPPDSSSIPDAIASSAPVVIEQPAPLGTGDAFSKTSLVLNDYDGNILVINGDVPLITPTTLHALTSHHSESDASITLLTCVGRPPSAGMGRILRNNNGDVQEVIEDADLNADTIYSEERNVGVYCFKSPWIWSHIELLAARNTGEVYITDLVYLAANTMNRIETVVIDDIDEGLGVNNGVELSKARSIIQERINQKWLMNGVKIIEPVFIDLNVSLGLDTTVYPNTFLQGQTQIGDRCSIGPGTMIMDSTVADDCRILQSVIEKASIDEKVDIGPYSHVRPDSRISDNVHLGNFVEVKNSTIGSGTKIGHFSYIGDSIVGNSVNIGAGAVTCNFDGETKHETVIENHVFIGSDSMLIAPLHIGAGASTGAGAVVTKDVPAGAKVVGMPAKVVSKRKI